MTTNSFCDLVPHVEIRAERMKEVESLLAGSFLATKSYYPRSSADSMGDFFAGFVRAYRPGERVSAMGVVVSQEDAETMIQTKRLEGEVLAGFSKMINQLINRRSRVSPADPDEFFADAFGAVFDAMVNYNGESSLSTFIHICLERRLWKTLRDIDGIRVPKRLSRAVALVRDRMVRERISFDEAVQAEGLSKSMSRKVFFMMSAGRVEAELEVQDTSSSPSEVLPSGDLVMKLVESVELGTLEKAALKGFLEAPSGKMGLSTGRLDLINPSTGRPYTRSALSAAWKTARMKLAVALKEVA